MAPDFALAVILPLVLFFLFFFATRWTGYEQGGAVHSQSLGRLKS